MAGPTDPTQLTPPRVAFIDERTGAISREWYRFLLSLTTATQETQDLSAPPGPDANSTVASLENRLDLAEAATSVAPRAELGTISAYNIDYLPYIGFDTAPSWVGATAGQMWFNSTTGSFNAKMGNNNITQQIGEEFFRYGKASSAIDDTNLQLVYKTGVVGASSVITFAPAVAGITEADQIIGIATESIPTNGFGRVTVAGVVHGINTTGSVYGETWVDNDDIWYNPVTGGLTKTKPSAPNMKLQVGTVINAGSGGSGSFHVHLGSSSVLGGTDSNVQFTSITDGDIMQYDSALGYWKNIPVLGVANGGTGGTTQATARTGIGATTVGSNFFTLANPSAITFPRINADNTVSALSDSAFRTAIGAGTGNGTVTSVAALTLGTTGTDLSSTVANGTTTPVITLNVPTASASNRGALSSTDWSTFNNKQDAISIASGKLMGRYSAGTGTYQEITISTGLSLDGSGNLTSTSGFTGGTLTSGLTLAAGTTTLQPLTFQSGALNTSAVTGVMEWNGTEFYLTPQTVSGRGYIPTTYGVQLSSAGSALGPAIADFFGADSSIELRANQTYEIEVTAYFLKTTAGTVTWTWLASSAPDVMVSDYVGSASTGITTTATTSAPITGFAAIQTNTTLAHAATPSLTTAVRHCHKFRLMIETTNSTTNLRLRVTSSAGTVTPQAGSSYRVRRVLTSGNMAA